MHTSDSAARPRALRSAQTIALLLAAAPAGLGQIFVAGYTFDAAAGPDAVTLLPGSLSGFAAPSSACLAVTQLPGLTLQQSVEAVLLDGDVDEWLFNKSRLQLDFTDNVVVNGPGADLVVFEIGGAESFALQVFADSICEYGNSITSATAATGFNIDPCGTTPNAINAAEIDLDDFGVLPGATVRRVLLDTLGQPTGSVGADIALVMALNSASPETDAPPCLLSFQQGLDSGAGVYAGAVDTGIASDMPGTSLAAAPLEYVDGSPERNLLLRFDGVIGPGPGQVPAGSKIGKATLSLCCGPTNGDNSAGTHAVHRLLQSWDAATLTFASGFGGDGVDANGVEAAAAPVGSVGPMSVNAMQEVDVTAAVQAWADGAPNHGLALLTASSDALGLHLSEAAVATLRPALSVTVLGKLGYAEAVASYSPAASVGACLQNAQLALGAPDWVPQPAGCCPAIIKTVTLGPGGSLALEFLAISISGGGSPEPDLWIYERGPDVEDTFVELSADGISWQSAGKVFGSVSAVDLDVLGFGPLDLFRFIRLTDDPLEGGVGSCDAGADIDAVAALSPNPWVSLGSSLPGTTGAPKLSASGALAASSAFQLAVTGGKPNGSGNLVLGVGALNAPFKGGTMVPNLAVLVPGLPLGPAGAIALPAVWPAGVPAGLPILVQVWIADAGGPKGFAATNALQTLTQ